MGITRHTIHPQTPEAILMKIKRISTMVAMVLVCGAGLAGRAGGTVVLNQIGDANAYNFEAPAGATPSQIFTGYGSTDYDCTVLEDFTVTTGMKLTLVSALFRASAGYLSFQNLEGYYLNVFSDAKLATAAGTLTGDVASVHLVAGSGAAVTVGEIIDPGGNNQYGLVRMNVDIPLPAGTYWVGVSLKSAVTTDQFSLMHSGATGTDVTPGNANGKLANPGQGLGGGALTPMGFDYAYSVTVVPEPSAIMLGMLGGCGWLCRRQRVRQAAAPA